ncbi:MAG: 16S rRNA (cytidine(1402)-2'-O)-methyltransferase [Propionibacteriaceae bacterium]
MTDADISRQPGAGVLILAGTPIGDASDASARLRSPLADADVIAAEDTRRLSDLLRRLDVRTSGRVVSYFEGNEQARTPALIEDLRDGATVLLVSDAGMPSISDPGYRLVVAAVEGGIRVTAAPGPSAVLTALALSGLPVDRFCFEGFLPRKRGERRRRLAGLADESRTMVFFEAPHRTAAFLCDAAEAFGAQRRGVVCRELTKTYEETIRGELAALVGWAAGEIRGEITLVIDGAPARTADPADAVAEVERQVAAGIRLKLASTDVAQRLGLSRRAVYDAVLTARRSGLASRPEGSHP